MPDFSYSLEQLKAAILASSSVRQTLSKLGLVPAGGNYATFRRLVAENGLDTSHFTGKSWSSGLEVGPRRPVEDYLVEGSSAQSSRLRKRLLRGNVFARMCYSCKGTEWLGGPIPLELEHINGERTDNRLENLCLLCPNCHALTPTYRGKNKTRKKLSSGLSSPLVEESPDFDPIHP